MTQLVTAMLRLFVDRSAGEVRVSEVAAGVSTTTVIEHFGTVNAVAAAGWTRHIPELKAIAATPATATESPIRRIEQVLLPLPDVLVPLLRERRDHGRLRRRMEIERLARSLVHLCTMQALLFAEEPDERIVDETLSLIFDGALLAPPGAV